MSPLAWIGILLLLGGIGLFFAMRIRGGTRVAPPRLNFSDGRQNVTTADAAANHEANKTTGEFRAGASVDGDGKGNAVATLGHEFTWTRAQRDLEVTVVFEFRTRVEISDGPAHASAIVNAVLAPDSFNAANDVLNAVGVIENPAGGGATLTSHRFRFTANQNQTFQVVVEASALAQSTDPADAAAASAVASGKVVSISVRPI